MAQPKAKTHKIPGGWRVTLAGRTIGRIERDGDRWTAVHPHGLRSSTRTRKGAIIALENHAS